MRFEDEGPKFLIPVITFISKETLEKSPDLPDS